MGKFNFKSDELESVRADAEGLYHKIGNVYCPYFSQPVAFNAKGIRHLKFKYDRHARPRQDQYARLKLLHLAPEVLGLSRTLQGIWHTRQFEFQKMHSRWDRVLRDVTFFEFIAVLDNVRIKVIVKQVGDGEKHFWSVIPFWRIGGDSKRRILHSGDPAHD